MKTEAIVNTANEQVAVGSGCDYAVYQAAGYDQLLQYRKNHIGPVEEGEVFLTPGFALPARYIIHAVSPLFIDGGQGEEEKLRSCYRKSLKLARDNKIRSVAFPLIATGGFGYPKEEGMRIAVDEIHAFLLKNDMMIYLVVFDEKSTGLGEKLYPDLEAYIDRNYVEDKRREEYAPDVLSASFDSDSPHDSFAGSYHVGSYHVGSFAKSDEDYETLLTNLEVKLKERLAHRSDTFSQYLLYLIKSKGMSNADVWKNAIVDKKVFSKIKNNIYYHPNKRTALCLCVGARLNIDETRDLLSRAGYALSPCDMTDIIFSYFIENEIFDMIELDIQLEEHGLPCIIS